MPSRLTVITGPPGVDIGPVAAHLGRNLDDGLAVRVVTPDTTPHTSPDPHHRQQGMGGPASIGAVRLDCLPSAWQDPQTNLGVIWSGAPDLGLKEDLHVMDALGLNPGHRVTVQHGDHVRARGAILPPIEYGDLGVIARDAVLRAGGRVQVEAGDGQTFLSALATVGIPPWASWIGHLDRWIALDAADMNLPFVATPEGVDILVHCVQRAVNDLDGSSGAYHNGQYLGGCTLRVAVLNAQILVPGVAAHDYNVRTGEGDTLAEGTGTNLANLLDAVADKTGVEIHLIGTGRIAGTGVWSWIESGENA